MTLVVTTRKPKVRKRVIRVGPTDDGRAMSLVDFDRCQVIEGYLYELGRGVIEVSDVPGMIHAYTLQFIRSAIEIYRHRRPRTIVYVSGGSDCKIPVSNLESERHPDLSIYCTKPPAGQQPWAGWIPEIVIEVVSESSRKRDYEVKPPEYAEFGVKQYWLIDPRDEVVVFHDRIAGKFQLHTLKPGDKLESFILPGFKLDVKKLLAAGK